MPSGKQRVASSKQQVETCKSQVALSLQQTRQLQAVAEIVIFMLITIFMRAKQLGTSLDLTLGLLSLLSVAI